MSSMFVFSESLNGEGVKEPKLPQCPWPADVWPMTEEQYAIAIQDEQLRTAISGFLMRKGWEVAAQDFVQAHLEAELEIDTLKEWKRQALIVLPDSQKIAKLLNLPLGTQVSEVLIPQIEKLLEEIRTYRELLDIAASTKKAFPDR